MNRLLYCFSIFLLIHTICFGQDYTIPLWKGHIPNYQQSDEIEIRDTTNAVRISNVQNPDISVYLPSKGNATGQAVIICPGGGYRILAYDKEGTDIAKWLNSKGIAGIVLKYRLPISKSNIINHKSPLLDAQRAIRLTRYHANEWNIKKDKIGIMGFSAGGHLASTVGTHFDTGDTNASDPVESLSSRPDFMILVYPVITFNDAYTHIGSRTALLGENPDPELVQYYSNELQVKNDTPSAFIVHAGDDGAVPVENSLFFYQGLKNKGISAELHIYPEGGHGFSLAIGRGHLETWPDRCIDWLKSLKQSANPKILNTHGDYPEAMRQSAKEENVPLIDLFKMSADLFESMGVEGSKKAFVHYPAGTFPGQNEELKDDSHFNNYGAYELTKCVVEGIKLNHLELKKYLIDGLQTFDPDHPDSFDNWEFPVSPIIMYQ